MTEPKKTYEVGDRCWYFGGHHKGKMTKGEVVHKFKLPNSPFEHYVIKTPTYADPLLVVRDWISMSHDGKGLGMFYAPHDTV